MARRAQVASATKAPSLAVLRRWIPDGATAGRARLAIAVNFSSLALAIGLYALIQPEADWTNATLLIALAALAVLAYLAEANLKLPPAGFFDAGVVLALLALGLAGPGPALLIWLVPEVMARIVTRRVPLITPGFVATVSSFALATLAGAGVLAMADPQSPAATAPALYTAGLVMIAVNFTVARPLCASFYYGFRPRQLIRTEFFDLAPAFLSMFVFGIVVWLLIPPVGVFALAPLALVIVAPQFAIARLARPRLVSALSVHEATALYADAMADVLRVARPERQVLSTAVRLGAGPRLEADELREYALSEIMEAAFVVLHVDERWDGDGSPAGLPGAHAPGLSRILAVARAWSELTAAGTAELTHAEALLDLSARSETEFDPEVVAAAAQVVRDEEVYVGAATFAPKLHRLALPRPVRRVALPAALARLAADAG
jgi:HD domain-containing protein